MDTVTPEKRSEIMSKIRSRHTVPEKLVASALRKFRATGWRRHRRVAGVELDFSWRRERVGLQVNGCFWHGCAKHYKMPKSNVEFWRAKVETNRRRDGLQARWLRTCGWLVIPVFECDVRSRSGLAALASLVARSILPPRRVHA